MKKFETIRKSIAKAIAALKRICPTRKRKADKAEQVRRYILRQGNRQ